MFTAGQEPLFWGLGRVGWGGRDTGVTAIWGEGVAGHTGQTNKSLYNLGFSPIVKACWAEPSSRLRSQPEHGIYISTVPPVCPTLVAPTALPILLVVSLPYIQPRAPGLGSSL